MIEVIGLALLAAAAFGTVALALQFVLVVRHRLEQSRKQPEVKKLAAAPVGISILKPLCGVDDDLEANLAQFATLGYPRYEVVLGVKDAKDPAYEVARAAVKRWPHVMRLELQQGEPGLNPKVNQLITLSAVARYEILLISDSNVRVGAGYLEEIAHLFEDPTVGCVSHPVSGMGEQTFGSLMDNLYLSTTAGAGQISAKRVANQDIVVGKSMALRREDVESLGGFFSVRNMLAEDYVIGRWVTQRLRKRAVVARSPVYNVSQRKTVNAFFKRYLRWSITHHTCIPTVVYLGQSLLNPIPWALMGALLAPSWTSLGMLGGVTAFKVLTDMAIFAMLRPERTPWMTVPAVLVKDALLFVTWVNGLFSRSVDWRGNKLRVLPGSRLVPPATHLPVGAELEEAESEPANELLAG
jgi:ceramide glucosyltransferase